MMDRACPFSREKADVLQHLGGAELLFQMGYFQNRHIAAPFT